MGKGQFCPFLNLKIYQGYAVGPVFPCELRLACAAKD